MGSVHTWSVNIPSIVAVHAQIFSLIVGAVTNLPPTKIPICFQTACSVKLQKTSDHSALKLIATTGNHVCHWVIVALWKYAPLSTLLNFDSTAGCHAARSLTKICSTL